MKLTDIAALDASGARSETRVSEDKIRKVVFDILRSNVLCSIATVTPGGAAHISTAYFCYSEELELYFLSHPRSVHCQNLSTNPTMAMAVFCSSQQWAVSDAGLQFFGACSEAVGTEAKDTERRYASRFPAYKKWKLSLTGSLESNYRFYRFLVLRLKVLDDLNIGDGVIVSAAVHRN